MSILFYNFFEFNVPFIFNNYFFSEELFKGETNSKGKVLKDLCRIKFDLLDFSWANTSKATIEKVFNNSLKPNWIISDQYLNIDFYRPVSLLDHMSASDVGVVRILYDIFEYLGHEKLIFLKVDVNFFKRIYRILLVNEKENVFLEWINKFVVFNGLWHVYKMASSCIWRIFANSYLLCLIKATYLEQVKLKTIKLSLVQLTDLFNIITLSYQESNFTFDKTKKYNILYPYYIIHFNNLRLLLKLFISNLRDYYYSLCTNDGELFDECKDVIIIIILLFTENQLYANAELLQSLLLHHWKQNNPDLYKIIFNNIAGFSEEIGEIAFSFLARNEKNHLVEDIFVKKNEDFTLINALYKINSCFGEKYTMKRTHLKITDRSIQHVMAKLNQIYSEIINKDFYIINTRYTSRGNQFPTLFDILDNDYVHYEDDEVFAVNDYFNYDVKSLIKQRLQCIYKYFFSNSGYKRVANLLQSKKDPLFVFNNDSQLQDEEEEEEDSPVMDVYEDFLN